MKIISDCNSLARRINNSWRKTLDGVLETASLCAQSKGQLSLAEKDHLLTLLAFNASTFSKLAKIGEQERLMADGLRSQLPSGYSVLYEIALLSDRELDEALADDLISPKVTRAELLYWKRRRLPPPGGSKTKIFGVIKLSEFKTCSEEDLEQALTDLAKDFNAYFVRRDDPGTAAGKRWHRRYMTYIRKQSRQHVREKKRKAFEAHMRKFPGKNGKRSFNWGFTPDEVEINSLSSENDILEVFKILGDEDQFYHIRNEAMKRFENDLSKALDTCQTEISPYEVPKGDVETEKDLSEAEIDELFRDL